MYLVRLLYASAISEKFSANDIENILVSARKNNAELDVTGLLCFNRKYFLQCLEGGRKAVNTIYHRILNDSRHQEVVLLQYREIHERVFSRWQMGYVPETQLTDELNLTFSKGRNFNPYDLHGESAHRLLLKLAEDIPVL